MEDVLQADCLHHPCYCEENVYHLIQKLSAQGRWVQAVFISNAARMCPFWRQKASSGTAGLVLWDYHVVCLEQPSEGSAVIWDLDSTLPFPCPLDCYAQKALGIGSALALPAHMHRMYRVVPGEEFLPSFASDRSHMRRPDGTWTSPPPPWPCITAEDGCSMRLHQYLAMTEDASGSCAAFGRLITEEQFLEAHSGLGFRLERMEAPALPVG